MIADGDPRTIARPSTPLPSSPEQQGHTVLFAGVVLLALILRFWRLGQWNFQATEMFTLRDSLTLKATNPRPLGYVLTHYLVGPFLPLDEFGLRLLPAVFGVLAVVAFYLVCRRLLGPRAALCGAFVLAVSPLQVMYSQLARYWSLVFLLSAIYPYALYLGIRERDRRWLAFGLVAALLAALAHPVAVLLLGGVALFLMADLRRDDVTRLWNQKAVRWTVILVAVLGAVILVRFVPVLHGWISMHDKNPGYGQFLRPRMPAPGMKQLIYLSIFIESLTVPVVLSALAGIVWLWQGRDRALARFLTCLLVFHVGFLTLLSFRTSVSQYYLLPVTPVFYLGAGVFLDQLVRAELALRPRWLLPATVLLMIVAAGIPTLLSDMRDGRRYDFRGAAHWIAPKVGPNDIVFSDQPMVMAYYLPQHPVRHLLQELTLLKAAMGELQQASRGGALWIVAPAASHAYRPTMRQGGMINWIYDHCELRNNVGVGRVDFRQNYLNIYQCASTGSAPAS
jgi:uncharacterized membrane protein